MVDSTDLPPATQVQVVEDISFAAHMDLANAHTTTAMQQILTYPIVRTLLFLLAKMSRS